MAARMGVSRIFSVESDVQYSRKVIGAALADRADLNLTMKTPDIGVTGAWGFPVNKEKFHLWPRYALDIWDDIQKVGQSPDLVLVDGRFRVACFMASMIFCNENAEILFDDYTNRTKKYGVAATLCKPTRIVGGMMVFHVPPKRLFPQLSAALARYSCIPD
ncbi:MAG: hypothetical protein EPO41_14615 [Reyranella sp.]|uniref:hypothetical protein n=1 Tax=Reyranella sp. TaxID=1929291 RepID=UPI0011F4CCC6|nr:hypothetical protein [Reyranella sp.]TAJ92138.1 MAG: hypothetical protein EPO41_14615 [Reyranella sp.]